MTSGIKHDTGKPRWSLLPVGTVAQVVRVLEFGAAKYALDNWKTVPDARTRYFDALMRHVHAWWAGERNDPETDCHHLAHAGCCVLFLLWLEGDRKDKTTHQAASFVVCEHCQNSVGRPSLSGLCPNCNSVIETL